MTTKAERTELLGKLQAAGAEVIAKEIARVTAEAAFLVGVQTKRGLDTETAVAAGAADLTASELEKLLDFYAPDSVEPATLET